MKSRQETQKARKPTKAGTSQQPVGRPGRDGRRRPFNQRLEKKEVPKKELLGVQQAFWVEGAGAVREYVARAPGRILRVESHEDFRRTEALLKTPLPPSVPFAQVPKQPPGQARKGVEREDSGDSRPFDVIRASVGHVIHPEDEFFTADAGSAGESTLVVVLDHITDPRNLGAIVRSCAFFGVSAVVAPIRRQVLLTHSSVATAMGGFAHCRLYGVVNLVRFMRQAKDKGFWLIGADQGGESLHAVDLNFQKKMLILGSEDNGMQRLVREECDLIAGIPGTVGHIESLNVSVAAGIFLAHLTGRP